MSAPKLLSSCAVLALLAPATAVAQDTPQEPAERKQPSGDRQDPDVDIVVRADRIKGQVDTFLAPVAELEEQDIAAYGVSSVADLVAALEPEIESSRGRGGRPVFLVNGLPIGSFREIRSYPPEAIRKVEVLPEEVAQQFGYPPDRRVVNFIIKENYSAITVEAEYEQPDRGGYSRTEQEVTLLKIIDKSRINLGVEFNDTTLLTESERDIIQTTGSVSDIATDPDPAEFRSLVADGAQIEAAANWATSLPGNGGSLSLNGTFKRSDGRSLSGLDSVILTDAAGNSVFRTLGADNPLERRNRTETVSSSVAFNQPVGDFRLNLIANASLVDSRTEIDRRADTSALVDDALAGTLAIDGALPVLPDAGFDVARGNTYSANSKLILLGSPLRLPAGGLTTTLDLGYDWSRSESEDSRVGSLIKRTRSNISGGLNVSVPVTSTREGVLDAIGSFTLNARAGFNRYSDVGTVYRWSSGVTWAPTDSLNLQATYSWREIPLTLAQLNDPQITTLNVPTFDFTSGETSLVSITTGGNPLLQGETQSDWNFSANWRLPFMDNARFQMGYVRNRSDNVTSSFPFLTPEIEAAFPGRVVRDGAGTLIALDRRPVDFFQTRTDRLTVGLSVRGTFGEPRPGARGRSGSAGSRPGMRPDVRPNVRSDMRPGGAGRAGNSTRRGPPTSRAETPENEERRARAAAFREKVCVEDGKAFLLRLVEAAGRGEALRELPDFKPERAQRLLSRLRAEDGSIDPEKVSAFRTNLCDRSSPTGRAAANAPSRPVRAGRPRGGPRMVVGRGGRFGGDGRGRFFVNLSHTIEMNREILITPLGPRLDLLGGDSLSSTGTPRHATRLRVGVFKAGVGLRLTGRYTGSSRIDGTGAPGSTNLFVGDLARFDLRLFADLGQVFKKDDGILKGMRASLRIDNVFDGRRIVRDGNGDIPLSFQPLLTDPTGRYVGIQLRKLF